MTSTNHYLDIGKIVFIHLAEDASESCQLTAFSMPSFFGWIMILHWLRRPLVQIFLNYFIRAFLTEVCIVKQFTIHIITDSKWAIFRMIPRYPRVCHTPSAFVTACFQEPNVSALKLSFHIIFGFLAHFIKHLYNYRMQTFEYSVISSILITINSYS